MDKKAKKILFSTYWKNGWKNDKDRYTDPEEFQYAKAKGLMFEPFSINHDECIKSIKELEKKISQHDIAKAFLSSLSTRRLDWRSALSSYAIAKIIPDHQYSKFNFSLDPNFTSYTCGICQDSQYGVRGSEIYENKDLNVLNFERLKWGGVRHGEILYTYFDLREFCKENIPEPNEIDISIFKEILKVIETSQPDDYPSALANRLSEVLKSNKNERETLIEILASIGVLKPNSYDRPIRGKSDWVYVEYWRGEDKYCNEIVDEYFGNYL